MNSTVQRLVSRRFDVLLTLFGFLGIVLFLALYNEAFPDATIELTLSRDQIAQRANDYLKSQGYDVSDYETVVDFNQDWWASIYLQRTLGVAETNRLVKAERLPIWTWHARWFEPQQQEEFSLELMPDGEVIGFSHTIPESAPGAALDQDEARAIAEKYLTADRQLNLSDLEETSASSDALPNGRIDHRFEWKRRNFAVGDGDLRRSISVQGDRVGSYWYWLRVPQAFDRDFSAQRNIAGYINNTAYFIGFTLFAAIALGALIVGGLRGVIEWRKALLPALLVGGISLLSGLNYLPLYKAGYSTTDNYALFWLGNITNILFNALYDLDLRRHLVAGRYAASQAALAASGQNSAARRSLADAIVVWLARPDAGRRDVWLRHVILRHRGAFLQRLDAARCAGRLCGGDAISVSGAAGDRHHSRHYRGIVVPAHRHHRDLAGAQETLAGLVDSRCVVGLCAHRLRHRSDHSARHRVDDRSGAAGLVLPALRPVRHDHVTLRLQRRTGRSASAALERSVPGRFRSDRDRGDVRCPSFPA